MASVLLSRVRKLERRVAALPLRSWSAAEDRLEWAREFVYGDEHPAAMMRLMMSPDDPAVIHEFRLDWCLSKCSVGVDRLFPVSISEGNRDPRRHVHPVGTKMIEVHDERGLIRRGVKKPIISDGSPRWTRIVIPPWTFDEGIQVARRRVRFDQDGDLYVPVPETLLEPPRTWDEARWLAGDRGDGLYIGCIGSEVRAIRVEGGVIFEREFAGVWRAVGIIR